MASQTTTSKTVPSAQTGSELTAKHAILGVYAVLSAVYLLISMLLPPDKRTLTKYQLSPASVKFLSLTVSIPLVAIWALGFYGYYRYRAYAASMRNTKEGQAHQLVANGLLFLALSLPVNSIMSNILTYYGRLNSSFQPASVIIGNYITIIIYLAAFSLLYKGVNLLLADNGQKRWTQSEIILFVFYVALLVVFFYLSLTNPARQFPAKGTNTAAYYLNDWLIVITVLIPHAVMWFMGIFAAFRLWRYRNNVKGRIYRSAFTRVAIGLGAVVALQIILRFLINMTTFFDKLTLKYLLLTIYILFILIGVGYWFIASGAKRLRKIEEV